MAIPPIWRVRGVVTDRHLELRSMGKPLVLDWFGDRGQIVKDLCPYPENAATVIGRAEQAFWESGVAWLLYLAGVNVAFIGHPTQGDVDGAPLELAGNGLYQLQAVRLAAVDQEL